MNPFRQARRAAKHQDKINRKTGGAQAPAPPGQAGTTPAPVAPNASPVAPGPTFPTTQRLRIGGPQIYRSVNSQGGVASRASLLTPAKGNKAGSIRPPMNVYDVGQKAHHTARRADQAQAGGEVAGILGVGSLGGQPGGGGGVNVAQARAQKWNRLFALMKAADAFGGYSTPNEVSHQGAVVT